MKNKRNYSNSNTNYNNKSKTNLKLKENYYSKNNDRFLQIYSENKSKKNKIKPPFKQGLYSYKQSFNTLENGYNNKIFNNNFSNNFYSNNSPIYTNMKNKKENNNLLNFTNNIQPWGGSHISNNNSSLSFSSINLNKYKINSMSSQNNKNVMFNNNNNNNNNNSNNNNNNNNNTNNNIITNNIYNQSNSNNNLNNLINIKKTNMSLNMNNINNTNNNNNNISKKIYQNYFNDNPKYEKESRRMIIEYIKVLGSNNIKQTLLDNNISLKVLNQKYNEVETNNFTNNQELFGEAKKQLYLKNLNYSLSYDSFRSNNNEENSVIKNNNNDILNLDNLNNLIFIKDKKKINILNFLFVPRILNLIEEDENIAQKCIFLITLDKIYHMEGKESYNFQWRDISTNEIENEFNLKDIKSCYISKKYNNRFIMEIEKDDLIENINFEIETPSKETCNNYVNGINYLMK